MNDNVYAYIYMNQKPHASPTGRKNKDHKGFTLFVALIVTSLLLAIAFSLSNIILKQLIFAQSGRASQIAFYAADSGAECALFWDRKNQFGTTTSFGAFATSTEGGGGSLFYDLYCGYGVDSFGKIGGFDKQLQNGGVGTVLAATTTFYVDFRDDVTGSGVSGQKGACAKVTVAKWVDNSVFGVPVERTMIDSRGYDVMYDGQVGLSGTFPAQTWGQGSCKIMSDRAIERAIRIDY